jgi:chemotaxis protein histidine kinase CheA
MSRPKPQETITPPNTLKAKAGGPLPKLDDAAVARAEEALKKLSHNFDAWMREEVDKLETAFAAWSPGSADETAEALYRRAHDIKGLAATYEFPLVTRIAASLCTLIETPELRERADEVLVRAHVEAIRAAVRDDVRAEDHPVGRALLSELEDRVAVALGA